VVEHTMDVSGRLRKQLEETSAELLRGDGQGDGGGADERGR
jgi:hypothetical protein